MSISGAVLNGVGSSFMISRGNRSGIGGGAMRVGRKNLIIAPHRKKSWVLATGKGDSGNSKNDPEWLDDVSQKASDYVKETGSAIGHISANTGQEVIDHIERAKNYIVEIASEAMDTVADNAKKASEYIADKGKDTKEEAASMSEKAKDFIVEKSGEATDSATDMSKKTAKYIGDRAKKAKEAILPPKTEE